jgi:hypothetical protein
MKRLADYITESEAWMHTPAEGDSFAFELPDEVVCETYIIEVADDCILLDATPEIVSAISEWATLEDTDEGDSGVIMETMGYGGLVGEEDDQWAQLRKDAATGVSKSLDNLNKPQPQKSFMAQVGDKQIGMVKGLVKGLTGGTAAVKEGNIEDLEKNIASAAVKPIPMEDEEMTEAEYQGRKVPLGKPMRGDVKKFKVYVKDPATGNIKKVNFGHGGTSAKRLGQKTMKIKKSNPARRKSFRARHNCANPGPRTKARYWSCRAW